jgi:hypothetical protein
MSPDRGHTVGAPARRPTDSVTTGFPGPLIPAFLSLSLTVGAIGLLFFVPTGVSLVMAVVAMFVGFAFLVAWIVFMLNDRDTP